MSATRGMSIKEKLKYHKFLRKNNSEGAKLDPSAVHHEIIVGESKPKATSRVAPSKMKVPKGATSVRQAKEKKEGVAMGKKNIRGVGSVKVSDVTRKPAPPRRGEQLQLTSYFKPKKNGGKKKY